MLTLHFLPIFRFVIHIVVSQVETLVNASPATVSRAGIIFVSDTDLDWSPVVEGWILKRPAVEQPVLKELFSRFVFPTFMLLLFCCFCDMHPTLEHGSLVLPSCAIIILSVSLNLCRGEGAVSNSIHSQLR